MSVFYIGYNKALLEPSLAILSMGMLAIFSYVKQARLSASQYIHRIKLVYGKMADLALKNKHNS